ncbi:MAG: NEL-type E3 ubiquitin ligase domain-containing protein [Pseudomonas sp.]
MRNTGLVMSAARGQLLAQLHDLRWMDLADNPLGESLDLSPFTRLISVDLSRCRLTGWPAGLTELMAAQPLYLNTVLLTQNPIAEVPVLRGLSMFAAGARNVPTLRISREALSEASLDRLLAVDVEPVEAHGQVLADWLQGSTAQVRLRAEALREQPEARFFMTALDRSVETQDYRADRQAGRVRIQQLLNALDDEPEGEAAVDRAALRNQLFDVGEEVMTTCGDGVQLFLRRCETLVQVYDVAQQAAADGDLGRLAQLGRRFYREHLLDEVAGRLYNARVTRRQVLFPDAVARAATAQELAALTPADEHGAPALAAMDEGDSASLVDVPDEAEIRLRLRIDLAQRLDLPPQAQHMRYFQAMSETIRERVTEAVNNADTPHARRAWILGQAWWVHCVQRHWQVRFQALREHWYAGHAYLLALQDADGELEPVPADVLRPLETFFPEHAWQREGLPQRVVLTEEESEAARQRLDSAQHEAERSLLEGLSAPVLGDDEAA